MYRKVHLCLCVFLNISAYTNMGKKVKQGNKSSIKKFPGNVDNRPRKSWLHLGCLGVQRYCLWGNGQLDGGLVWSVTCVFKPAPLCLCVTLSQPSWVIAPLPPVFGCLNPLTISRMTTCFLLDYTFCTLFLCLVSPFSLTSLHTRMQNILKRGKNMCPLCSNALTKYTSKEVQSSQIAGIGW